MLSSMKTCNLFKNIYFATFGDFGVNPITENIPIFSAVDRGNLKNCSASRKTFTQSCAEKYDGVSALYRMKFDSVLRKI